MTIPSFKFGYTNTKPTLLMSDVDESFIYGEKIKAKDSTGKDIESIRYDVDGLSQTANVIQDVQKHSPQPLYVWWNTVRVLDTIKKIAKHETLKPILNRFKLDGLIVNNGKQIFINNSNKQAADWINSLDENSTRTNGQINTWKDHIETTLNWKQELVEPVMREGFTGSDFAFKTTVEEENKVDILHALPEGDLRPTYQIWQHNHHPETLLYYSPAHNTFRLLNWNNSEWKANNSATEAIVDLILEQFKKNKIHYEAPEIQTKDAHDKGSKNTLSLVRLSPKGVNKASTTQFALDYITEPVIPLKPKMVERIIVVGDDKPDLPLLTNHYTQAEQAVQKTTILCHQPGRKINESPIKDLFQSKELNGIQAQSGAIGPALEKALQLNA